MKFGVLTPGQMSGSRTRWIIFVSAPPYVSGTSRVHGESGSPGLTMFSSVILNVLLPVSSQSHAITCAGIGTVWVMGSVNVVWNLSSPRAPL